jgi:predicted AlkP superfamily phosphohydrolase/phosphomutase
MAIKYYTNPEKQETYAVLSNCQWDAINRINKYMGDDWIFLNATKYMMPRTFKAKVRCSAEDTYDESVGRKMAKEKVMKKYYKCFDRKLDIFREDLINLNSKVFETPIELMVEGA